MPFKPTKALGVGEYHLKGRGGEEVIKPRENSRVAKARARVKELEARFRERYKDKIKGEHAVSDFVYTYSLEVPGLDEIEKVEYNEIVYQLLEAYRELRTAVEEKIKQS